jgi:flavin-dependent dehydrogenase
VDPVSGDGMFEAFLSGKLASEAVLDLLDGRAEGLEPYGERLTRMLGTHLWASWGVKAALDRFPRTTFRIARSRIVWRTVERLVRGDIEDVRGARGLARPPLKALEALARVAGNPGGAFRQA